MSKNKELLESFTEYCVAHPEMRFFQALRNWVGYPFVYVGQKALSFLETEAIDTFYWEVNEPPKK